VQKVEFSLIVYTSTMSVS